MDAGSAAFAANAAAMEAALAPVLAVREAVEAAAEAVRARYAKRGQVLPRARLALLLDPGAPWLELCPYAGWKRYGDKDGTGAGAGAIAGIGRIEGRSCVVVIDNFAVKGGTVTPDGLAKKLRLQEVARENRLPLVSLSQSGGANLQYAHEVFIPGGRGFANQARLSALGIPQVTLVHGSATAGGAYQPGLSDYVIMVRGQATMYLAGPPLLKAATGEVATDEELGGAAMHTQVSGVGDYLAEDDADGIRLARAVIAALPWPRDEGPGVVEAPLFPATDLMGLVPADPRQPYDCREIVARLVDGSAFLDFKPEYDAATVCGHARIEGHAIGLIGNNGPITAPGAAKAGQFIQLCDQAGIPLLFLHNTTGFLVGTEPERAGIIKHGSKMIQAVANARVPKISVVVGGSYGAGNYAMCGRGFDPRFLFAWPNARTSVMGPAQAGQVMRIVTEAAMARAGAVDAAKLDALEQGTAAMLAEATTALASSARLEDDGIIDPRQTRDILGLVLGLIATEGARITRPSTFGVARL
ncbi:acyl-CoA carboxylase subunit beta [Pararhodobacter aggregans]|uniref:Acetyl-CoA carboxylase carboxyltransferase subunit n=1 Tax=Pararhodobacter aggregans TaxID=404875 RepID=A0A2T7UWS7_9RHOB|nr:carboxyl transferase domain-containing protein [Pararhodobacter aggregans]PTX04905.1 geranyl-CoA carboxylase beta subunit [Pararhodobacter aggregans]PVE49230.1 acetyl-CoA carboxylase carboxyltransferase subunit [Pararhodobacter aggregans]